MNTQTEVGLYTAAVKLKTVLVTAVTSLGTVLLPRLSYYVVNKMEAQFKDMIVKSFNFVLIFAVPLCVYFILFAKDSVLLLSGEAFLGATIPMQVLMPTLVFIGLSNITGIQILVPEGKEKEIFRPFETTKENGIGLGLNIVKDIVEKYHGDISVKRSETMLGAKFIVTLPKGDE